MNKRDDEYLRRFLSVIECEISCEQLLESIRWGGGFCCPRCGATSGVRMVEHRRTQCRKCRYQASPTAGTIFHRTHLPLSKWFLAIFLIATDKRGTSALRLQKLIDVSYKTALVMLRKLRMVMSERVQKELSGALLYAEECILGNKQSRELRAQFYTDMTEDQGNRIRAVFVAGPGGSTQLEKRKGATEASNLVAGGVSLLKEFLLGTYHRTSRLYAQLYFDEFAYRFNRDEPIDTLKLLLSDCICRERTLKVLRVEESSVLYGQTSGRLRYGDSHKNLCDSEEKPVYTVAMRTLARLTTVLRARFGVLSRLPECDNCIKQKIRTCSNAQHLSLATRL